MGTVSFLSNFCFIGHFPHSKSFPSTLFHNKFSCLVTLLIALLVHSSLTVPPPQAAAWNPTKAEFLIISGNTLPAEISLHHGTKPDKQLISFGKKRRNFLRFSPTGRSFVVAGLGNLPGELDFFVENEFIRCSSFPCCVTLNFASDGLSCVAAVTAPRMKQDNMMVSYDCCGNRLGEAKEFAEDGVELVYAGAAPAAMSGEGETETTSTTGKGEPYCSFQRGRTFDLSDKLATAKKRGDSPCAGNAKRYVPPSLRGTAEAKYGGGWGGPGDQGGKAGAGNKKKKKGGGGQGGGQDKQQAEAAPAAVDVKQPPASVAVASPESATAKTFASLLEEVQSLPPQERSKKLKNLSKKWKQIQGLKESKEGGKVLTAEEEEKLNSAAAVQAAVSWLEENAA